MYIVFLVYARAFPPYPRNALFFSLLPACSWTFVCLCHLGCCGSVHAHAGKGTVQVSPAAAGMSETGDEEDGDELDEGVSVGLLLGPVE